MNPAQKQILRLHGIPCVDESAHDAGQWRHGRFYYVPVTDLDAPIVIEKRVKSGGSLTAVSRKVYFDGADAPALVRIARRAAVRAAYATQSERVVVELATCHDGGLAVRSFFDEGDAVWRWLAGKTEKVLPETAVRNGTTEKREPILLGADVEFVLLSKAGTIVSAERYLPRRGIVGCDALRHVVRNGTLSYPLAELRPPPAARPEEVFRHLLRALRLADRRIPDKGLQWKAGGLPFPGYAIGGHIHFSGIRLHGELLRVLDNYLALPVLMLEEEEAHKRRPLYGYLGDFRRKRHGGFEYRTLASWIVDPLSAAGILMLARLIVDHYSVLSERPLNEVGMQAAFYAGDKAKLLPVVRKIWTQMEHLPDYGRYGRVLDRLKQRVLKGESWKCGRDVRAAWRLLSMENEKHAIIESDV